MSDRRTTGARQSPARLSIGNGNEKVKPARRQLQQPLRVTSSSDAQTFVAQVIVYLDIQWHGPPVDQLAPHSLVEQPLDRPQLPPKLDAEASRYVIGDQAREAVAIPGFRIFAARSGRDPDAGEQQTATSPSSPP